MKYVKYKYQVNVRECTDQLISLLNKVDSKNEKIKEFISAISLASDLYFESVKPDDVVLNEYEIKQLYVISVNHPAFEFWLAHSLALTKPNKISLVLDEYYYGTYGEINNFLGSVQYRILDLLEKIPLTIDNQIKELINWHREIKKELHHQSSLTSKNIISKELTFIRKNSTKTELILFDEKLQVELKKLITSILLDKKDQNSLTIALEGYILDEYHKIKLQVRVSVLVDMFARIKQKNNLLIVSTNKNVATWIRDNFLFYYPKLEVYKATSIDYCEGVFSNKNRPQKNKRLNIDELITNCIKD